MIYLLGLMVLARNDIQGQGNGRAANAHKAHIAPINWQPNLNGEMDVCDFAVPRTVWQFEFHPCPPRVIARRYELHVYRMAFRVPTMLQQHHQRESYNAVGPDREVFEDTAPNMKLVVDRGCGVGEECPRDGHGRTL